MSKYIKIITDRSIKEFVTGDKEADNPRARV